MNFTQKRLSMNFQKWKCMDKVIKIGLSMLVALGAYFAGYWTHALTNRKETPKQVRQAIVDVTKACKKAMEAQKRDYEDKLKKKDEIIKSLLEIIERLLSILRQEKTSSAQKLSEKLAQKKESLLRIECLP